MGWTAEKDALLRASYSAPRAAEIAAQLGHTTRAVINRAYRLRLAPLNRWTTAELEQIRGAYQVAGPDGVVNLDALANVIGRDKQSICAKAREMGLSNQKRKKVEQRKDRRKFATDAELRAHISERTKRWIKERGHPRGALGMRHTPETLGVLSRRSRATWAGWTQERREAHTMKATMTRRLKGTRARQGVRGTWKAGWREIGGRRVYFRSRWEANYACYLEWLKAHQQIADWEHEPHTFWFEGIRRGCVSYLPDFKVTNIGGSHEWHEVKGWMDARSRTTLKRMAKYFPSEKVIVIREKQYAEIRRKVSGLVPGWEDDRKQPITTAAFRLAAG